MITRVCSVTMMACPLSIKYVLSTGRHDLMSYLIVGLLSCCTSILQMKTLRLRETPKVPRHAKEQQVSCVRTYCKAAVLRRCGLSPGRGTETSGGGEQEGRSSAAAAILPSPAPWEQVGPTSLAAAPSICCLTPKSHTYPPPGQGHLDIPQASQSQHISN